MLHNDTLRGNNNWRLIQTFFADPDPDYPVDDLDCEKTISAVRMEI